jgi:hypothetical protein
LTEAGIQVPVPRRDLHITGFNQNDGSENTHVQTETKSGMADRTDRDQSVRSSK